MKSKEEQMAEEAFEIERLRSDFWEKHRAAEKAAYVLFAALPVGPERTKAHDVYSASRTAPLA